jgi:hypothetical protein
MKILNPIPNGRMSTPYLSKTVEISSYNSDTIISPAQGTIVSSDKLKCDGNIKIEHFIDGETYYSNFCKVNKIMSFRGNQVRPGELIGTVGDFPIEYTVTDKHGSKLDVNNFLSGVLNKTKDKDKDKYVSPKNFDSNSNETLPNPFMDLLLSPLSIINKAFSEKSTLSKRNSIKEDINKIKKLIKY